MTEDEMAGWHHWLDGRESEWTPGAGDGQGGLACCDSWGRKESNMTERLNWTDFFQCNKSFVKVHVIPNYFVVFYSYLKLGTAFFFFLLFFFHFIMSYYFDMVKCYHCGYWMKLLSGKAYRPIRKQSPHGICIWCRQGSLLWKSYTVAPAHISFSFGTDMVLYFLRQIEVKSWSLFI